MRVGVLLDELDFPGKWPCSALLLFVLAIDEGLSLLPASAFGRAD